MDHICIDMPNTNNKYVGFELTNFKTFIIHDEFELANIDMIHILTRHEYNP